MAFSSFATMRSCICALSKSGSSDEFDEFRNPSMLTTTAPTTTISANDTTPNRPLLPAPLAGEMLPTTRAVGVQDFLRAFRKQQPQGDHQHGGSGNVLFGNSNHRPVTFLLKCLSVFALTLAWVLGFVVLLLSSLSGIRVLLDETATSSSSSSLFVPFAPTALHPQGFPSTSDLPHSTGAMLVSTTSFPSTPLVYLNTTQSLYATLLERRHGRSDEFDDDEEEDEEEDEDDDARDEKRILTWKHRSLLLTDSQPSSARRARENRHFRSKRYRDIWSAMRALAAKYPHLASLHTASDMFDMPFDAPWFTCDGDQRCKIPIFVVGNKEFLNPLSPEVFLSGALHGDERIGPVAVAELAGFLCTEFGRTPEITYLLNNRVIYIMPFPNPWGYAHNRRDENGLDPNRDFPYKSKADDCMKTFTARAINELFRRHLFRLAITFHGGMRLIGYEWGSFDHSLDKGARVWKSKEAPDQAAQFSIAKLLQASAGKASAADDDWFYGVKTMTEGVYPVHGGMEDWSYSASWQPSPDPITRCKPANNTSYDEERTIYDRHSLRCSTFLIETDDSKDPAESTLGWSTELWHPSVTDGHVPRNMRIALKLAGLAEPDILFSKIPSRHHIRAEKRRRLRVSFHAVGCVKLTSAELFLVKDMCPLDITLTGKYLAGALDHADGQDLTRVSSTHSYQWLKKSLLVSSTKLAIADQHSPSEGERGNTTKQVKERLHEVDCRGLGTWERLQDGAAEAARGRVTMELDMPQEIGEYCVLLGVRFDQAWAKQQNPEPRMKPQSHVARSRLEDGYYAVSSEGHSVIEGRKNRMFPRNLLPLTGGHPTAGAGHWIASPMATTGIPLSIAHKLRSAHAVVHIVQDADELPQPDKLAKRGPEESKPSTASSVGKDLLYTFVVWFEDVAEGGEIDIDVLTQTVASRINLASSGESEGQSNGSDRATSNYRQPDAGGFAGIMSDKVVKRVRVFVRLLQKPWMDENDPTEWSTTQSYVLKMYKEGDKAATSNVGFNPPTSEVSDGVLHTFQISSAGMLSTSLGDEPRLKNAAATTTTTTATGAVSGSQNNTLPQQPDPEGEASEILEVKYQTGRLLDLSLEELLGRIVVIERLNDQGQTDKQIIKSSPGIVGANQLSVFHYTYTDYRNATGSSPPLSTPDLGSSSPALSPTRKPSSVQHNTSEPSAFSDATAMQDYLMDYWTSGRNLICILQNPSVVQTQFAPTHTVGHIMFNYVYNLPAQFPLHPWHTKADMGEGESGRSSTISKEYDVGTVLLSGRLCRIDTNSSDETIVLSSLSNCCPEITLSRNRSGFFRPFADRIFTLKKPMPLSQCYCGPGSRFRLKTASTEYTCALGYASLTDKGDYDEKLCPWRKLPAPQFAKSFTTLQLAILGFIAALFLLGVVFPYCTSICGWCFARKKPSEQTRPRYAAIPTVDHRDSTSLY